MEEVRAKKIFDNNVAQVFWRMENDYRIFYIPTADVVDIKVLSDDKKNYTSYKVSEEDASKLALKNAEAGSPSVIDKIFNHFHLLNKS